MQEDKELERDPIKDEKMRKRNVYLLIALIVVFLIGILMRWEFVSTGVSDGVNRYFSPDTTDTVVVKEQQ